MTDLHLGPTADYQCRGFNTLDSFKTVLEAFESNSHGEELLVFTGDLASDAQPGAYQQLNKILIQKNPCRNFLVVILYCFYYPH